MPGFAPVLADVKDYGKVRLGAFAAAIPAVIAGAASFFGQQSTNATNLAMSQQQMAFQQQQQQQAMNFNAEQSWEQYLRSAEMMKNAQSYNTEQAQAAREFDAQQSYLGFQRGMASQSEAERFNSEQWDKAAAYNRANMMQVEGWEEGLSNTAYQRSVADMKKAGLNPILGVSSGGAGTPSVSPASAGPVSVGALSSPGATGPSAISPMGSAASASVGMQPGARATVANSLASGINSGLSALRTIQDVQATQVGMEKVSADTANTKAQTSILNAQLPGITAHSAAQQQEPEQIRQQIQNMGATYENLVKEGARIGADTRAALAAANASNSAADASAAAALLTRDRDKYFVGRGGVEAPTAPAWIGIPGGIAGSAPGGGVYQPGQSDSRSDFGKSVTDWLGDMARSVGGFIQQNYNSAAQASRRTPAPSMPSVVPGTQW